MYIYIYTTHVITSSYQNLARRMTLPNCQLTQVPNIVTSEWAVIGNGLHTSHLSQQSLLRIRNRNAVTNWKRVRQRSRHHQSGAGQLPMLDPEWINSETCFFWTTLTIQKKPKKKNNVPQISKWSQKSTPELCIQLRQSPGWMVEPYLGPSRLGRLRGSTACVSTIPVFHRGPILVGNPALPEIQTCGMQEILRYLFIYESTYIYI